MADYSTLHTVYCAGVNEALKGSGYTISCTRKGYNTVITESGAIMAKLANIEFERSGAVGDAGSCLKSDRDISVGFNHPTMRENSTPLSLSEIKGYQIRTVLVSGELSEWVEVER